MAARWGFVKVLYSQDIAKSQGVAGRGILAFGGGTYWDRTLDSVDDSTQTNTDYDEYDDGETFDYQVGLGTADEQEVILYFNFLVPTSLRASGSTPGWPGTSIDAAPDQANHQIVANYYAAVVSKYIDQGVTIERVVLGGEFRGMWYDDPGATAGLPQGWDVPRYWDLFEKTYDAIKSVSPTTKVYGPYVVFWDDPDGPNTTIGTTDVSTESITAFDDFMDLAVAAGKIDGVCFDAVLPITGWQDLLPWVKERIGSLPMLVAECYTSYTAGVQVGNEITTELLDAIDAELREGDTAMIWGEPALWASAPLVIPTSTPSGGGGSASTAEFVVETGAADEDSNSYCTVEFADSYLSRYGNPATWTAMTRAAKEAALREATRIADDRYSWRFTGLRLTSEQGLEWPRSDGVDNAGNEIDEDVVPRKLQEWTARAALAYASGSLTASEEAPTIVSETLTSASGASKSVSYTSPKRQDTEYVVLDRMLVSAGLIRGGGPMVRVTR